MGTFIEFSSNSSFHRRRNCHPKKQWHLPGPHIYLLAKQWCLHHRLLVPGPGCLVPCHLTSVAEKHPDFRLFKEVYVSAQKLKKKKISVQSLSNLVSFEILCFINFSIISNLSFMNEHLLTKFKHMLVLHHPVGV